jgi:hypothetical protein
MLLMLCVPPGAIGYIVVHHERLAGLPCPAKAPPKAPSTATKMIKRSMCGRANFNIVCKRVVLQS